MLVLRSWLNISWPCKTVQRNTMHSSDGLALAEWLTPSFCAALVLSFIIHIHHPSTQIWRSGGILSRHAPRCHGLRSRAWNYKYLGNTKISHALAVELVLIKAECKGVRLLVRFDSQVNNQYLASVKQELWKVNFEKNKQNKNVPFEGQKNLIVIITKMIDISSKYSYAAQWSRTSQTHKHTLSKNLDQWYKLTQVDTSGLKWTQVDEKGQGWTLLNLKAAQVDISGIKWTQVHTLGH